MPEDKGHLALSENHPVRWCLENKITYGPLVKRLRHHPFTVVTWVRVPYGSPAKKHRKHPVLFCCLVLRTGNTTNPSVRVSKLDLRCFAEVLRSGKHRCLYGVQNSILFALFCINAPPMYANTCEIVDYECYVKEKYCGVEECVIRVQ